VDEYWTDVYKEALKKTGTLEDVLLIAGSVLFNMKKTDRRDIVMVCGPISTGGFGNYKANMLYLKQAIYIAVVHGLFVFDQTRLEEAVGRIAGNGYDRNTQYSIDTIKDLCHGILNTGCIRKGLFLPGWANSAGTCAQRRIFANLEIQTDEYPIEWLPLSCPETSSL